jgi:hypothetical protein
MQTLGLDGRPPERAWWKELFWPLVEDDVSALTAARNGMYACMFIAILSTVMVVLGALPPALLFNSLFFLFGAIGIRQLSLLSAAAMTSFYAIGLAAALQWPGWLPLLVLMVLIGATRAAWYARRLAPQERYLVVNPAMELSGLGRVIEGLPAAIWPSIRVVYAVVLAVALLLLLAGVAIQVLARVR